MFSIENCIIENPLIVFVRIIIIKKKNNYVYILNISLENVYVYYKIPITSQFSSIQILIGQMTIFTP